MKLFVAKRVAQKLTDNGFTYRLYEEYSGRGAYGKTTAGVVLTKNDVGEAQKLCPQLKKCAQDSLGFDTILY